MTRILGQRLLQFLRVPPEPTPPAGSHDSVQIFRADRNFYRLLLLKWVAKQLGVVIGTITTLHFVSAWTETLPENIAFWIRCAEWLGLIGVFAQMPFTYALVRFDYDLRWYIVTDRSLRIRSGIWEIREMTLTFANIQQITVEQGPLQRWLGLADLMVRTAGGGGSGEDNHQPQAGRHTPMHIGVFHGVGNAGEIRDLILDRLRRWRDAGLGDPEDSTSAHLPSSPAEPPTLVSDAQVDSLRQAIVEMSAAARELQRT
jgi:membrane protein YdbS with pleckstrin-like domain